MFYVLRMIQTIVAIGRTHVASMRHMPIPTFLLLMPKRLHIYARVVFDLKLEGIEGSIDMEECRRCVESDD